jgi:hypothetical protein
LPNVGASREVMDRSVLAALPPQTATMKVVQSKARYARHPVTTRELADVFLIA